MLQSNRSFSSQEGILDDRGIRSKTKSSTPMAGGESAELSTIYDVLVKLKDFHKAIKAMAEEK
ncbi:hypothetical protein LCM20_01785 [Halobacillus litoralis]|uniref:hypothetical protein n=1 Tax=Halobacillus litoralis TaxID=45668 RepID=UPI001CD7C923|nr:hypothetical protein [Halobacillus litoralis]MCA0969318.1 hypothetical protein [Halobacillus litoralis]